MQNLADLYQETILDHKRHPRNFRVLDPPEQHAEGHNPLCGDRILVYVRLEGERIADVAFQGTGCAISQASASMMTERLKGSTPAEAEALFTKFHDLVMHGTTDETGPDLGKLELFAGVAEFPMRVKCASLAWHTLRAALAGAAAPVTTEE